MISTVYLFNFFLHVILYGVCAINMDCALHELSLLAMNKTILYLI